MCVLITNLPSQFYFFRTFLPKLHDCDTDDDLAMCFLKNKEGFEQYLQYLVGQSQAEAAVSDKAIHHFFKVPGIYFLSCPYAMSDKKNWFAKLFLSPKHFHIFSHKEYNSQPWHLCDIFMQSSTQL